MKFMLKMYRLSKPVVIYTSYLFTMLTLLYLTGHTVFPKVLVLKAGILWGIFFFSLGSILAQRVLLGSGFLSSVPYKVRCFLYLCAVGMWGYGCLRFWEMSGPVQRQEPAGTGLLLLMLLAGVVGCAGFELFNRCRAHMYNTLLEQYKKRRKR